MKVTKHRDGSITVKLDAQEASDLTYQIAMEPLGSKGAVLDHHRARYGALGILHTLHSAIHKAWGTKVPA